MMDRTSIWSIAFSTLFISAPALAAKATVISYLGNSNSSSLGPSSAQCGVFQSATGHECEMKVDVPLLPGTFEGLYGFQGIVAQTTYVREGVVPPGVFGIGPGIATGTAQARALPGSLHAQVEVQLNGSAYFSGIGVGGYGYAEVEDKIKVRSATLADGTAVQMSAQLGIAGTGRGAASLRVDTLRSTTNNVSTTLVFDQDVASSSTDSLESLSGSFTAYVGESLNIVFALRASAGLSNAAWRSADVLNGRISSSSYGNSAYLYFASDDPSVQWVADSGASYRVAEIPEPGTYAMMLFGLVALGTFAKRRSPSVLVKAG